MLEHQLMPRPRHFPSSFLLRGLEGAAKWPKCLSPPRTCMGRLDEYLVTGSGQNGGEPTEESFSLTLLSSHPNSRRLCLLISKPLKNRIAIFFQFYTLTICYFPFFIQSVSTHVICIILPCYNI